QQATTGASFVHDRIKPAQAERVFPDTPSMFVSLQAGQIDVAVTDTAIVLSQAAASGDRFEVVGQYATGESYGAIYPKGSPNAAAFDKILKELIDDGTMKKLGAKY